MITLAKEVGDDGASAQFAALTGASSLLQLAAQSGPGNDSSDEKNDVLTVEKQQLIEIGENGQVVLISVHEGEEFDDKQVSEVRLDDCEIVQIAPPPE